MRPYDPGMRTRQTISAVSVMATVVLMLSGCGADPGRGSAADAQTYAPGAADGFASGVYAHRSPAHAGRWVLLLPGASGLKIFDDPGHYFRAAEAIAGSGFDVLVVDYKAAYRRSSSRPNLPTGGKIAWVVEQAIDWARRERLIHAEEPGAVVAWSLGAEGLWPLFGDSGRMNRLGIVAAAAYYPSNEQGGVVTPPVPFLVLTGESDDVTSAAGIRASLADPTQPPVEAHFYPGAHHGFDVETIGSPRTVSLIPFIGPSATFGSDAAAAADARSNLLRFLDTTVKRREPVQHN